MFGLIEGRNYGSWLSKNPLALGSWTCPLELSIVPLAFKLSLMTVALFITNGRARAHRGQSTMLDFSLFSIPSFKNGNIAAMIVSLGEFGNILSLPIWLQNVMGYSALQTGLLLLPLAAGSFAASGFAGAFGNRSSALAIVRAGIVLELVGVALLGFMVGPEPFGRWKRRANIYPEPPCLADNTFPDVLVINSSVS